MGRMRLWNRAAAGVAAALMAGIVLAACGGGDGGGGAGGAEEVVTQWVQGWSRTSGATRDDFTAGQMRRLLTGDLAAQTEGAARGLNEVYNDIMQLRIPWDERFEIVESSSQDGTATVTVQLFYSDSAASSAAAAGVIPSDQVGAVHEAVSGDPLRRFTLVEVEGDWKIQAVDPA